MKSRAKGRSIMLVAATGTGKTFIAGGYFRRLLDINYHEGKTMTPWPYVYVTKASIVEQTKRVFKTYFDIDPDNEVLVINIDQLRSEFGKRFVREEIKISHGEETVIWRWRDNIYPVVILWDECQCLKNTDSQQSEIAQAYNDIESEHTIQIFMSATPLTRVCEAKCWAVATKVPYQFGISQTKDPLTNAHWPSFAEEIAAPDDPIDHSPSAINRLMNRMDKYVVRVKGVKSQFKAINKVEVCQFESPADKEFYSKAWERHLDEISKIRGDDSLTASQSRFMILVEILKFRMAAELCHANDITKRMFHAVQEGFAACAALNFKGTIVKAVSMLVYNYGVSRDQISIIWGGGITAPTKKQKLKMDLVNNPLALEALADEGISLEDLDLDEVETPTQEQLDPKLRLGVQNAKERQREIDKFQRGESLYCFYTFRAGGVGLSLHHTDELTKEKVRHKQSGYAYEEDIAKIPTRPRVCYVAPTYSAMELVQGLGRCPRLTSLSDTTQILLFYSGTIEERVARIVSVKLKCLTKVVRQRESWETVMVGQTPDATPDEEIVKVHEDTENGNGGTDYYDSDSDTEEQS
jgi:hypothetical protein